MGGMSISFGDLGDWQRAEVARHLAQTYAMTFGCAERAEALVFRLAYDDPAVVRTEPPPVLLRELRDAAAKGGTVKAPRLSKPDAARVSELLLQSAARAEREGRDGGVTTFLTVLWRDWDAALKVPADEYQRAELARWDDRPRPARRGAIT